MEIPRPEHPNPQFERTAWTNLNGEWEFEIDNGQSGIDRKWYERDSFDGKIIVPFCPESELSGVGYKDFMPAVWYRRTFKLDSAQADGRVLLHFGAVDYETTVYINQKEAGRHRGGYTSFVFDITDLINIGENTIIVCAADDVRNGRQPRGKQSEMYYSHRVDYTRTTGIWQTVWLEYVPMSYIKSVRFYPDAANQKVTAVTCLEGAGKLSVEVLYQGSRMGGASAVSAGGSVSVEIPLSEKFLWEPGEGRLYDVVLKYGDDEVNSYFGLRDVRLEGMKFLINGRSVFQRLVLDQGFYPDGIYTAPTEDALINDIRISMDVGFNGARLHEKVFEPRFLYHCDRMGYIVWGEFADWGFDHTTIKEIGGFLNEWREAVERDFNHPAIIGWCPLNEAWDRGPGKLSESLVETLYRETKVWDPTRPCIDCSGGYHVMTDIFDVHNYEQDPKRLAEMFNELEKENCGDQSIWDYYSRRETYGGEPIFVSEYGGIKWLSDDREYIWGYGEIPKTVQEFTDRFKELTDVILDNKKMFGLCYTQLYDVEQEVNGLYTYDRKPKFDSAVLRGILSREASIEKDGNVK